MNQYFDKIFLISSFDTQNRLSDISEFLNKENIKYELIIAPKKKYFNNITIGTGAQSLISVNESIFLKCKLENIKTFCILEDDLQFGENYKKLLDNFMNIVPSTWDILNLGYHVNSKNIVGDLGYCKFQGGKHVIVGTHIVCYKNCVIDLFLNESETTSLHPLDLLLQHTIYPRVDTYTSVDKMFYGGSFRSWTPDKHLFYKKYVSSIG